MALFKKKEKVLTPDEEIALAKAKLEQLEKQKKDQEIPVDSVSIKEKEQVSQVSESKESSDPLSNYLNSIANASAYVHVEQVKLLLDVQSHILKKLDQIEAKLK